MDNSRLITGLGAPSAGSLWCRTSERTLALLLATARGLSRHSGSIATHDERTGLPHYHWPRYSSTQPQPRSLIFAAKWLEKTRPIPLI
jgi:hypothetical protein